MIDEATAGAPTFPAESAEEAQAEQQTESVAETTGEDAGAPTFPAVEAVAADDVDADEPDTLPSFILMAHPDGGETDSAPIDEASGHYAVPIADIGTMLSHGFVPATEA